MARKNSIVAIVGGALILSVPADAALSLFNQRNENVKNEPNSQQISLLEAPVNLGASRARGGGDIVIDDSSALVPETGPAIGEMAPRSSAGSLTANQGHESNPGVSISIYTVHAGDTLADIAKMFGVSVNTILWANDLSPKTKLSEGQILTILPISGVEHTVKAGDSMESIAAKYHGDKDEIALYNADILINGLTPGLTLIIPDGEMAPAHFSRSSRLARARARHSHFASNPAHDYNKPYYPDYYTNPLPGSVKTQDLHGYNAVDLASAYGADILAAADGTVIVSHVGGWGGGYGNYIVLAHDNGTQTLYAHLSKNLVKVGETVAQGQTIGLEGTTGHATGPHLHFEIRGAANPF